MIPTFEEQTSPLTEYEESVLLPLLIQGFSTKIGQKNCVTNPHICKMLKAKGFEVSEPRIRKIVFHIRHNNLVPRLIASSKGYWIATSKEEIESWLNSLNSRIGALMETREYATSMLSQWDVKEQEPSTKETIIQTKLFDNYGS
jgi:hypothetical protein